MRHILIIVMLTTLAGCAAALVPYTSDPKQMIANAYWLFDDQVRPLPAERMILEAIDIYKEGEDQAGLAQAYIAYSVFLRSYAVGKYSKHYSEHGFLQPNITFEDRYNSSIEYLDKAGAIYQNQHQYDLLTNVYLHMGFTYWAGQRITEACSMFVISLEKHKKFTAEHPDVVVYLEGYGTYQEYLSSRTKEINCEI